MRYFYFLWVVMFLSPVVVLADVNSYGLLKYSIPGDWRQQARDDQKLYMGNEPESGQPLEILVHASMPAPDVKIDSVFRLEWARLFAEVGGVPAIGVVKKRFSTNSLQYAESGAEIGLGSEKRYVHIYVFVVEGKMQTIQVNTPTIKDFKRIGLFVSDFLDTVDTVVKRKE